MLKLKFYRKITLAGEYLVAGTPALYERDRDWEKINIPGPIKEDILIYVIIQWNENNHMNSILKILLNTYSHTL